jgi:VWFA-related protein
VKRAIAILTLSVLTVAAQQPPPDTVIRINVNLVQVDAVVTDAGGKPVVDLKQEDFQVLQDGKPQAITNFSFVDARQAPAATGQAARRDDPPPPPATSYRKRTFRPSGRILALVVDDLGLSFESIAHVRSSLRSFVETRMQPDDLVAVIRTGAGMGSLQQFTSDKQLLLQAIDRVKFNSLGRVGIGTFAPLGSGDAGAGASVSQERQSALAAGSTGAIRYVLEGLRELPGRKSVILFSEDMRIPSGASLKRLTDAANRASVVIHGIDPRGLQYTGVTAADNTMFVSSEQVAKISQERSQYLRDSDQGLYTLASETGGLFFHDSNDVQAALRKAVDDGSGYYLIGYRPDSATFDGKKAQEQFHRVQVRVKRSGLTVRSRGGFMGNSDSEPRPVAHNRQAEIAHALFSPFGAGALHVRLTSLFFHAPGAGSFLSAMLHIDARELRFEEEPDGWHKAVIDLVAMTFGENGQSEDPSDKTFTVRLKGDSYRQALQQGLIYFIHHRVRKPGAYQLRVVLRDAAAHEAGSASQFMEVPDVDQGAFALSGILLHADAQAPRLPPGADLGLDRQDGRMNEIDPRTGPAIRIFKAGMPLAYSYQILNAQPDSGGRPRVESQLRLFRDGQLVYESQPTPLPSGKPQKDPRHLLGGGQLKLGAETVPGDYVLQIVVTDKLVPDKSRTVTQSIDFEIER